MATFKVMVHAHHIQPDKDAKTDKKKTAFINIRVTHNRKKKYINTGLAVTIADLTKTFEIKNMGLVDETNMIVKSYRDKCNIYQDQVSRMGIDDLIEFLTSGQKFDIDFLEFANKTIERLKKEKRTGVAKNHQSAINALERYIGRKHLSFREITVRFLQGFEDYVRNNPMQISEKKVAPNKNMSRAPSLYLGSMRALYNILKDQYNDEDVGIIRIPFSPFAKYKVPAELPARKRALPVEQVRQIINIEEAYTSMRFTIAKDAFILSLCLIGMNSADLYHCTKIKNGHIIYNRKKTATRRQDEALFQVQIQPEIAELMKRYKDKEGKRVFNFYKRYATANNFNQAINKGLKEIGLILELDDLEFYAARHSWATIARNDVGIDKMTVHEALNHVQADMKITDRYITKDWSIINNANRKVLDLIYKV